MCRDIRDYTQETLHVGGNLNNGSNDGFFNWNVNNTPSNANWNIGSRNFLKLIFGSLLLCIIPHRLVKIKTLRIAWDAVKSGEAIVRKRGNLCITQSIYGRR